MFPKERTLDGIKVVVDCANGAAYHVAPQVFEELGADVMAIGVEPNGRNINDKCGAMHPEAMAEVVRREGAALGDCPRRRRRSAHPGRRDTDRSSTAIR